MTQRVRETSHSSCRDRIGGFTLIELMVTIGIIVVLLSMLVPMVSRVRQAAYSANSQQSLATLAGAIEAYYHDHRAYPGPLGNEQLWNASNVVPDPAVGPGNTPPSVPNAVAGSVQLRHVDASISGNEARFGKITGNENLVLGLMGGLDFALDVSNALQNPRYGYPLYETDSRGFVFDPKKVGQGPLSLNTTIIDVGGTQRSYPVNLLQRNKPYLDVAPGWLSSGRFKQDASIAEDSIIPEFLDRFPDPLPLLYLRARAGASGICLKQGGTGDDLTAALVHLIDPVSGNRIFTQYDLRDVLAYTDSSIGSANASVAGFGHGLRNLGDPNDSLLARGTVGAMVVSPWRHDALPYLRHPSLPPVDQTGSGSTRVNNMNRTGTPRQKDTYILISAGPDRVYGTLDDITNFGSVGR